MTDCPACNHPEHGVEDCCAVLVRSGEGERFCGCIEGVDG